LRGKPGTGREKAHVQKGKAFKDLPISFFKLVVQEELQ